MKIRSQMARLGALSVLGVAACGGTAFNAIDAGGDDASLGNGDGPKPDAPGTKGHDSGPHDAGKAMDAAGDRSVREDAVATDAAGDATEQDAHAGKDAGIDGGSGTGHDAEVDAGHDAGQACASKMTGDGLGVFVKSGGSATACGTRESPCPDLPSALGALNISMNFNQVYVARGTYAATAPIALPDGVVISGGWTVTTSGNWTGSCDPMDTPTFEGSGEAVLTVGATTPSAGHVTLDTVNVTNTATATTGESVYGIMAVGTTGSDLVLNDVTIKVPSGGAGAQGTSGQTGAMGVTGAPGCPMTAGGGTGTTPSPIAGTYGPSGYTPQSTTSNQAGLGVTGAAPAAVTSCAEDAVCLPGTACGPPEFAIVCTPAVESGCGGVGGTGGYSGGGGGASIALFLWNENATLQAGAFIAGNGGAGAPGGTGGPGGGPGAPASGGATKGYNLACNTFVVGMHVPPQYGCEGMAQTLTAPPGNPGGTGGAGGTGAGGAGGDSYSCHETTCQVRVNASSVLFFRDGGDSAGRACVRRWISLRFVDRAASCSPTVSLIRSEPPRTINANPGVSLVARKYRGFS